MQEASHRIRCLVQQLHLLDSNLPSQRPLDSSLQSHMPLDSSQHNLRSLDSSLSSPSLDNSLPILRLMVISLLKAFATTNPRCRHSRTSHSCNTDHQLLPNHCFSQIPQLSHSSLLLLTDFNPSISLEILFGQPRDRTSQQDSGIHLPRRSLTTKLSLLTSC